MSDSGFKDIVKRQKEQSVIDAIRDEVDDALEDKSIYKAYKVGLNGKAESMLAFNFRNKPMEAFHYFNIDNLKLDDNLISIIRTHQIFTLKGENLKHLIKYFLDSRIQQVYEFDPDKFDNKPKEGEPIIHEIIITDIKN